MRRLLLAATVVIALAAAGACTAEPATPTVPRLESSAGTDSGGDNDDDNNNNKDGKGAAENPNAVGGDGSAGRRAKLHAAAECIRQHGATGYQDPLLTSDGYVYTDDVALRSLDESQLQAIQTACGELIREANFSMHDQGPAPPKLIQAGVRSAECLRANGLPDFKDPTADSRFSPGKGFGLNGAAIPAGGKENPAVKRALGACRQILDEEAALSSLGNLGDA